MASDNAHMNEDVAGVRNVLMGQVYLGDWQTGEYLAYPMTAIADFRTDRSLSAQGS